MFGKNYGWGLYAEKNMYKMFGCGCFSKVFFYLKMHQNNFFYFLKIIFDTRASKWFENKKK